jgi:hypothetical protein
VAAATGASQRPALGAWENEDWSIAGARQFPTFVAQYAVDAVLGLLLAIVLLLVPFVVLLFLPELDS